MPAPGDAEAIVQSMMPQYGEDHPKTRYLSFRASGFQVREAAALVGVSQGTVMDWRRQDEHFKDADTRKIGEIRKTIGHEFAYVEFLRNFRLVMIRDGKLLKKQALVPENLTAEEKAELGKIRQYYTPRELETVMAALRGEKTNNGGIAFNFTQVVMEMSRRSGQDTIIGN